MHGQAVGQLQLLEHGVFILGRAPIVKEYHQRFFLGIHGQHNAHIAVENARAVAVILAHPFQLIVVLDVHHLVALAEDALAVLNFGLFWAGRVEGGLQHGVEGDHAARALLGGRKHLDGVQGIGAFHVGRQPAAAKLHHRAGGILGIGVALEKEIAVFLVQHRHFAMVDGVGVAHDQAAFALAEDLVEPHRGDHPAAQDIAQHVARAHGGQLIGVAHQDQPRAARQRAQEGAHQEHIHHGHLIHNQAGAVQRIFLIARKLAAVAAVFQQAVQRAGLAPGGLAHALGGAAGRGGQQHAFAVQQGQDAIDNRGFARAGAAGDDQQSLLRGHGNGFFLRGRKRNALGLFKIADLRVHRAVHDGLRRGLQIAQAAGDLAFRLPQLGQKNALHAVHHMRAQLAGQQQRRQVRLQ